VSRPDLRVPRKPRQEVEGAVYHVYARGNGKQWIFLDDQDRQTYLFLLRQEIKRRKWRCLAYCLMNNHVHLLIETPEANLGRGIQRLHGAYAQIFNERHGRVGHLFQGRYGAVRIESDEQLVTTLAYIAANPVRSGLCADPADWPWSSYRHARNQESGGVIDLDRLAWYVRVGSDPLSGHDSRGLTP
jgi:putative transposase